MSTSSFTSDMDADMPSPLPTLASTTDDGVGLVNVNQPALLLEGNYNDTQPACAAGVSSDQGPRRSSRLSVSQRESGSKDGNPFGLGKPTTLHNLKPASTTLNQQQKLLASKKMKLDNAEDAKERLNEKLARAIDEKQKSEEELGGDYELMNPVFEPMAKALEILEPCSMLSYGTKELKNNPNKLQPNTDASFAQQGPVALSPSTAARMINNASLRGSNPDWVGATFGSRGTRKNKFARSDRVDAAISDMKTLVYAEHKKRGIGLAALCNNWDKKIPEFAFKGEIGLKLVDENGEPVTEEDYKKKNGHKKARSFELANAKGYDKMRAKTRYHNKDKVTLHHSLVDSRVSFYFTCVRYDEEGILGSVLEVGANSKRRKMAKYRYTIADNAQHFAPYEELDIGRED